MRSLIVSLVTVLLPLAAYGQAWSQWGGNAQHESNTSAIGNQLLRIEDQMVLDPFVDLEKSLSGNGTLLVHYQAPVVDGDDLFLVVKSGNFTFLQTRETQTWNVTNVRRVNGELVTRWTYTTDWKPVPFGGGVTWEPVYHVVLTADAVWAAGAGGTIDKIDRNTGARIARLAPFGPGLDPNIYVTGPPTATDAGDIYYNAIRLQSANPWSVDPVNSWLVHIAPDGTPSTATIPSLTPNAPAANDNCTTAFSTSLLPWPPGRDAVAPATRCGPQRPGINVAPAVAPDGTVYTVSRAHLNDRWAFLIAVNRDLTPKWSTSLRNRFNDGCNVLIPPNGTPGGCRTDARTGVDPAENQPGSGRVTDLSTSSPVVAPDGNIIYGAFTTYNYRQGHLMMFAPDGTYLRGYQFGWDITPAIYGHDGTYSILLKENRYATGSYCSGSNCPGNRTTVTPQDPEQYLITSLDPNFGVEWQFKNTETRSCGRDADGNMICSTFPDHPNNFEWCVNAIAVDARGMVYANAEDGFLYAINPNGTLSQRIFLRLAIGAAYTPLSIGSDGRIYTQNDGMLFVVGGYVKRRAVRR